MLVPVFLNMSAKKRVKANSLQHNFFIFTCTSYLLGEEKLPATGGEGRGGSILVEALSDQQRMLNSRARRKQKHQTLNFEAWRNVTEWAFWEKPWESQGFLQFLRVITIYNPYVAGSKPSFFMVLGSKGSW